MKFINVRELKNKTSEMLKLVGKDVDLIVTKRGKPIALIHHFSEDDIEDYVLLNHPKLKKRLEEAYQDYLKSGGIDIDKLIEETEAEVG